MQSVVKAVNRRVSALGEFVLYVGSVFRQAFQPPFRWSLILQHIEFIGNRSLNIVLLTGFFTGAVFGLQIGGIFRIFKAEGMLGGATGLALATELAPLVTGFLLAGRAGSAMAAEIATMVVNEQVDAMEAMGVDPVHYLVVPRMIASVFIMPFLCGLFMFIGVIGCYLIGQWLFAVDQGVFMDRLSDLVDGGDVVTGLRKMVFFALGIAMISCRVGLQADKGAKGVGLATTSAVVLSLLAILCTDFVVSYIEEYWLGD